MQTFSGIEPLGIWAFCSELAIQAFDVVDASSEITDCNITTYNAAL